MLIHAADYTCAVMLCHAMCNAHVRTDGSKAKMWCDFPPRFHGLTLTAHMYLSFMVSMILHIIFMDWKQYFKNVLLLLLFIIGIQPLGQYGQRPEFSQATDMALVRCILAKFLGVACHCFPPPFRCSHFSPPGASTSATTQEIPAAKVGTVGENVVR